MTAGACATFRLDALVDLHGALGADSYDTPPAPTGVAIKRQRLENPARFLHHKRLSLAGPFFMNDARDLLTRLPLCFMPDVAGDLSMTAQYMTRHPVYIVIDDGHCQAHEGLAEAPDVTLRIRDDHLIKLMTGRMRGITAFLTGKIKVEGNYILAQRLQQVFDPSRIV